MAGFPESFPFDAWDSVSLTFLEDWEVGRDPRIVIFALDHSGMSDKQIQAEKAIMQKIITDFRPDTTRKISREDLPADFSEWTLYTGFNQDGAMIFVYSASGN